MAGRMSDLSKFEVIDLRDFKNESLLEDFYREIYLPAFPISSQRENPEVWSEHLWGIGSHESRLCLRALIAGTQLRNPKKRQIYAGHFFEFHNRSCCGLLTYLVVSPKARNRGLGRLLLERALCTLSDTAKSQNKKRLRAVFGEINNPREISVDEDSMDPWDRLAIFERLGARVIDIPYVQPELVSIETRNRCLLLVAFSGGWGDKQCIHRSVVLDFLKEYYKILGVKSPELDNDYISMESAIDSEYIPLIKMEREQATI